MCTSLDITVCKRAHCTHEQENEEGLESALINLMKRKRHRDPKGRRRGLVASTMSRRADSDEEDGGELCCVVDGVSAAFFYLLKQSSGVASLKFWGGAI